MTAPPPLPWPHPKHTQESPAARPNKQQPFDERTEITRLPANNSRPDDASKNVELGPLEYPGEKCIADRWFPGTTLESKPVYTLHRLARPRLDHRRPALRR